MDTPLSGEAMLCVVAGTRGRLARRPRNSKLALETWRRAAELVAEHGGNVPLKRIEAACGVSHRTAWRLRNLLRDAARVIVERGEP
jgi:hypothetical protein